MFSAARSAPRPTDTIAPPMPRAAPRTRPPSGEVARRPISNPRFAKLLIPRGAATARLVAWVTVCETPCRAWETWSDTFFFNQLPKLKRGLCPSPTSVLNVATAFHTWLDPREAR